MKAGKLLPCYGESDMVIRVLSYGWLFVMCCLVAAGCGKRKENAVIAPIITFEIRVPKKLEPDSNTPIHLMTAQHGDEATSLRAGRHREDGAFLFFQHDFVLSSDSRRALAVSTDPSQVFRLSIPRTPQPTEWTQWQRPDYVEGGDAVWTFMNDLKADSRSTNVPPDCFELRYKIETRTLGKTPAGGPK